MIFEDRDILDLKSKIRSYMSEKRYLHTLGVEAAAERIGSVILPARVNELRVCALLHDIAKELGRGEMLNLIRAYPSNLTDEDLDTESALHSFAAPELIKRDFPEYASEDILSAVFTHTLGSEDMDVFSEIIFVSDFVEEHRQYEGCIKTARYLFSHLSRKNTISENIAVLHRATVMCIDYTEESLKKRGLKMNKRSFATREMFKNL